MQSKNVHTSENSLSSYIYIYIYIYIYSGNWKARFFSWLVLPDFTLADSSVISYCLKLHRICRKRFRVPLETWNICSCDIRNLPACRGFVCFPDRPSPRKMLFLVVDSLAIWRTNISSVVFLMNFICLLSPACHSPRRRIFKTEISIFRYRNLQHINLLFCNCSILFFYRVFPIVQSENKWFHVQKKREKQIESKE